MKLIDADALKKTLNFVYDCVYIDSKSKEGIVSDIIDELDTAPAVDSRDKAFCEGVKQMENNKPIVIDCKYYLPCGRCDKTNGFCPMLEVLNLDIPTKPKEYPVNPNFYVPVNNDGVKPV